MSGQDSFYAHPSGEDHVEANAQVRLDQFRGSCIDTQATAQGGATGAKF
jgi:hypothetical protein